MPLLLRAGPWFSSHSHALTWARRSLPKPSGSLCLWRVQIWNSPPCKRPAAASKHPLPQPFICSTSGKTSICQKLSSEPKDFNFPVKKPVVWLIWSCISLVQMCTGISRYMPMGTAVSAPLQTQGPAIFSSANCFKVKSHFFPKQGCWLQ